jgi:hypothetical protein
LEESCFLGFGHLLYFRVIGEMQKNVGKFDVSMYDEQVPNVFAAKHNLLQDLASL